MCIATARKNKTYNRINVLPLNFPINIKVVQNNAMGVNISGIIWLTVHDTLVNSDRRKMASSPNLRNDFSSVTIFVNKKMR
jgi:hypothetical protein